MNEPLHNTIADEAPVHRNTRGRRLRLTWLTGGVIVVAIVVACVSLAGNHRSVTTVGTPADDDMAGEDQDERPSVKTIHPRRDATIQLAVTQIASVEPYFRADLHARVSGIVRTVNKGLNDVVKKGEVVIEIDVPDLAADVALKRSVVGQRTQELKLAKVRIKEAEAACEVASTVIRQRLAEVKMAEATNDFREKRLARYRDLFKREVITIDVLEEQERDTHASRAAVEATKVAVERARADLIEAQAKLEAVHADINWKEDSVEVAVKDWAKAREYEDYTRIRAPSDGVVVVRNVNPGDFVQNASTGQTRTLMSINVPDLVTVVARFPDNAAPYIERGTNAVVEIDEVSGLAIAGKITRHSDFIQSSDRTMRVEIDLVNGNGDTFRRLARPTIAGELAPLAGSNPLCTTAANAVHRQTCVWQRKGENDPFPQPAVPLDRKGPQSLLIPGYTGMVKLQLARFANSYVVPSNAVYTVGGKPYILVVREDVTQQIPVRVHVNDGRLAKVSSLSRQKDGAGGMREVLEELSENDEIVATRQVEIGDGQAVIPHLSKW